MTSYMSKHSELMPKSKNTQNFLYRVTRYGYIWKLGPLKQSHFQDLQSDGIFLGSKAKFLVMKSWSLEVDSDFCLF